MPFPTHTRTRGHERGHWHPDCDALRFRVGPGSARFPVARAPAATAAQRRKLVQDIGLIPYVAPREQRAHADRPRGVRGRVRVEHRSRLHERGERVLQQLQARESGRSVLVLGPHPRFPVRKGDSLPGRGNDIGEHPAGGAMDDVDVRIDEPRMHRRAARIHHSGWPVASEQVALGTDLHDRRAGDGHRAPGKHPPLRVHGYDDGVAHQQITGHGAIRPGPRFSVARHSGLVHIVVSFIGTCPISTSLAGSASVPPCSCPHPGPAPSMGTCGRPRSAAANSRNPLPDG